MNKNEFLEALRSKLEALPEEDAARSLDYYAEMIDDRVEDGMTEEEAVAQLGDPNAIAEDIIAETPLAKIVGKKLKKRTSMSTGTIILLILGSPLWAPLLIAAVAVVGSLLLALFAVLASIVITLFAVTLAFAVTAVACLAGAIFLLFNGQFTMALAAFAAALVFAGLTVPMFLLSKWAAVGMVDLFRAIMRGIKLLFTRKGN